MVAAAEATKAEQEKLGALTREYFSQGDDASGFVADFKHLPMFKSDAAAKLDTDRKSSQQHGLFGWFAPGTEIFTAAATDGGDAQCVHIEALAQGSTVVAKQPMSEWTGAPPLSLVARSEVLAFDGVSLRGRHRTQPRPSLIWLEQSRALPVGGRQEPADWPFCLLLSRCCVARMDQD